jgi:hypothetical protein
MYEVNYMQWNIGLERYIWEKAIVCAGSKLEAIERLLKDSPEIKREDVLYVMKRKIVYI